MPIPTPSRTSVVGAFGMGKMAGAGGPPPPPATPSPQTGDFILVHFLQKQAVGFTFTRTRNTWPLHMTLVPWFATKAPNLLVERLDAVAGQAGPFDVVLGGEEQFNEQTRVTILKRQGDMHVLHEALLAVCREAGVTTRNDQWTGSAYRAHVTHHDAEAVPRKGDRLRVAGFSLVRLLPNNQCGVARNFYLGLKR